MHLLNIQEYKNVDFQILLNSALCGTFAIWGVSILTVDDHGGGGGRRPHWGAKKSDTWQWSSAKQCLFIIS